MRDFCVLMGHYFESDNLCVCFPPLEKVHEMEKEHLNKVQTANEVKASKL